MDVITRRKTLTPEERKLPVAKYFDLPLYVPGPREQQLIDSCPIDPSLAIKPENFLDLLQPDGYSKAEYGYCMMEDGSGYIATYTVYPLCTPQMLGWWFRWLNIYPKGMPPGQGNIRYKIWNPADHFDHGFLNGKDKFGGIYTVESLDLGAGEPMIYTIRHAFSLKDYGLTEERDKALKAAGCWVDCAYESFHPVENPDERSPGTHLCLTLSRANPLGYMEKCTREWIGCGVKDGKVFRDESTPASMLCEEYLKKVLIHGTVEAQQLSVFLPSLYAEYKDKPDDAD
jgi:hypothetical protein